MKLHYCGKYSGKEEELPQRPHEAGAVAFREAKDTRTFALIANGVSLVLTVACIAAVIWRGGLRQFSLAGALLSLVCLVPHEFLHGLCFRGDVYLYQNLSQGMLFVVGPEDMSRARFIFMSLLPNLVFGVLPFAAFLLCPELGVLGTLGAISIGCGAGDYINVYNALTQMPKGARTYLCGFHSYWYMPKK